MATNRFAKGSGCYTCQSCHRQTRETNPDASSLKLCALCYEIGGLENQIADGGESVQAQARIDTLTEQVRKLGGKL